MESIVDTVSVVALLALVEDRRALVDTSRLHTVVFHFGVVALGASLLDDHFALAATFSQSSDVLVLVQPLFVFTDVQFRLDDFT